MEELGKIVDNFVMHDGPEYAHISKVSCPECRKEYSTPQGLRKHMAKHHAHTQPSVSSNSSNSGEDAIYMYNYSCAALSLCLLSRDFEDARKLKDGERTIRLYKYLMLYFRLVGKSKYSYHSLRLLTQVKCLLSPRI